MTYSLVDLWTAHKDEGGKPLVYRVENRPGPCVPTVTDRGDSNPYRHQDVTGEDPDRDADRLVAEQRPDWSSV
jgi:hypothetical protein